MIPPIRPPARFPPAANSGPADAGVVAFGGFKLRARHSGLCAGPGPEMRSSSLPRATSLVATLALAAEAGGRQQGADTPVPVPVPAPDLSGDGDGASVPDLPGGGDASTGRADNATSIPRSVHRR